MNPYHLLYYKIYAFLESINAVLKNTIMEWSAMFLLTVLVYLNIFAIASIVEVNNNLVFIEGELAAKVMGGIVLVVNYFVFIRKKRYKQIISRYSKRNTSLASWLVVIYVVVSIWAFFHYGAEVRDLRLNAVK